MKWWVYYSTGKYDEDNLKEFDTELQVLTFLNNHTNNPEFTFQVIEGREVKYRPVEVVLKYQRT